MTELMFLEWDFTNTEVIDSNAGKFDVKYLL